MEFLCVECEDPLQSLGDCCALVHQQDWAWAPVDQLIGQEFDSWLPERIYDVHLHLWCNAHFVQPARLLETCPVNDGEVSC